MEASTEQQSGQQEQRQAGESSQSGGSAGNGAGADSDVGRIEEITGVVVEAAFTGELPEIYSALETEIPASDDDSEPTRLVLEVQQHLGDDRVRCVAMDATDGLKRGAEVRDTGGPISVPVGEGTLGRMFNLLG